MNRHVECPKMPVNTYQGPKSGGGQCFVSVSHVHNCNAKLDITGPSGGAPGGAYCNGEDSNRYGDWWGANTAASYKLSRLLDW